MNSVSKLNSQIYSACFCNIHSSLEIREPSARNNNHCLYLVPWKVVCNHCAPYDVGIGMNLCGNGLDNHFGFPECHVSAADNIYQGAVCCADVNIEQRRC